MGVGQQQRCPSPRPPNPWAYQGAQEQWPACAAFLHFLGTSGAQEALRTGAAGHRAQRQCAAALVRRAAYDQGLPALLLPRAARAAAVAAAHLPHTHARVHVPQVHRGSADSGHYWTYVRLGGHTYAKFDDRCVTTVGAEEAVVEQFGGWWWWLPAACGYYLCTTHKAPPLKRAASGRSRACHPRLCWC